MEFGGLSLERVEAAHTLCAVSTPRRLVLADDHEIVREALRLLLEREGAYVIVGETANGAELPGLVGQHRPDAVVLDLMMPGLTGAKAARRLRDERFAGGIVVLSAHAEPARVREALEAGADAYVLKMHAFAQLQEALTAALRRERYLSPQLKAGVEGEEVRPIDALTRREREILQLVAEGHGTKEIAFRLGVSAKTIESHRLNLMRKLSVHNVADLTRLALREGLISL